MGKNAKAREAEQRRQYQEARRREEMERQKRQNRLMWQIVLGAAAIVVLISAVVLVIGLVNKKATMDSLDLSAVDLSNCTDTEAVTDLVRLNISYTDKDGNKQTGDVIIRLYEKVAPITVKNFQTLVKDGFYDGLTFHRVYAGFMIQGGDPKGDGTGSSTPIKGEMTENGWENNLSHIRGVVSMARRGDSYDSGSCQFFIMHANNADILDGKYASFGYVVYGMETVDGIAATEVEWNDYGSEKTVPVNPVTINYATFVNEN